MRTVRGCGDHEVVVGAGLAGLSAALHLAGRGRAVTVVERDAVPGGRGSRADIRGYRLDTEPTVLTMPYVIDDTLIYAVQDRLLPDLRDDAQVLVLAGSSTVPGVVVSTALTAGRLAADRITRQSAKSLNLKAGLP